MGLRHRRLLALAPAGLALLAALAGTGAPRPAGAASTTTSTSTTTTVPAGATTTTLAGPPRVKKGGVVTIAVPCLPTQFNPNTPAGVGSATAMVTAQLWPSPFVVGPGDAEEPSTAFDSAELVGVKPETIVYTIAKAARWSDGTPITSADFVEEWKAQLAYGPQMPATDPLTGYRDIASVTGSSNGKVVTVVFAKPYADWEGLFASLVPAEVARRYGWVKGFAGSDPAHLLSGGPYEVTSVVPGKRLVLGRNPQYWGNPPTLDKIVFEVVRNESRIESDLVRGRIDLALLPPSRALDEVIWSNTGLAERVSLDARSPGSSTST